MRGIGTLVNILAIAGGATIGLFLRGGLKERYQKIVMQALGLASMFVGLGGAIKGMFFIKNGALETTDTIVMILSLVVGAVAGELLQIEDRVEKLGEWFKNKFKLGDKSGSGNFAEGFITSSLLYCVGAMAVVGALEDGLMGNASTLYAKALIDGVAAVIFTSTLGIGVYFSCIPLAVYQGGITFLAGFLKPFLTEPLINNMSLVGSILIFGIGINMIWEKKLRIGNMLPAIFIPIIYELILGLFH